MMWRAFKNRKWILAVSCVSVDSHQSSLHHHKFVCVCMCVHLCTTTERNDIYLRFSTCNVCIFGFVLCFRKSMETYTLAHTTSFRNFKPIYLLTSAWCSMKWKHFTLNISRRKRTDKKNWRHHVLFAVYFIVKLNRLHANMTVAFAVTMAAADAAAAAPFSLSHIFRSSSSSSSSLLIFFQMFTQPFLIVVYTLICIS